MLIGQLAAALGVNPKTIRYYEAIKLLPKPQRDSNGFRVYAAKDKEQIQFILQARTLDLSLKEISEILALRNCQQEPCPRVLAILDKKLAAIDHQIHTLTILKRSIQKLQQETTPTTSVRVCRIIEQHETLHS